MAASHPQWNPVEVLEITTLSDFQCVGTTKKGQGRKCRCRIAKDNRERAAYIFRSMARSNIHSADVEHLLQSLASCLLCQRFHHPLLDKDQYTQVMT